jgi:hypothetical protein
MEALRTTERCSRLGHCSFKVPFAAGLDVDLRDLCDHRFHPFFLMRFVTAISRKEKGALRRLVTRE